MTRSSESPRRGDGQLRGEPSSFIPLVKEPIPWLSKCLIQAAEGLHFRDAKPDTPLDGILLGILLERPHDAALHRPRHTDRRVFGNVLEQIADQFDGLEIAGGKDIQPVRHLVRPGLVERPDQFHLLGFFARRRLGRFLPRFRPAGRQADDRYANDEQ